MAAFNDIRSEKPTVNKYSTHDRLQANENICRIIKNVKYKKLQRLFNLSDFIKVKCKTKNRNRQYPYVMYKNKTFITRKRRHRLSKIKKSILKMRRDKIIAMQYPKTTDLKSEVDTITENFADLELNTNHKYKLHSRRFRDYCDNLSSNELCLLVEKVLRKLFYFQKRTYENNQFKGRYRRRIVIGFREVQAQLQLNKLKLVVIATDCEKCDVEGGLDSVIGTIKIECANRSVPCAFALLRRQISYALFIRAPVSCVGIKDYDGVQDTFLSLIKTLQQDKMEYKKSLEISEK